MGTLLEQTHAPRAESPTIQLDAIVIGTGIAGLYQLYRLREMGLQVRAYDTASGVGGTWYWNRYPGARFDSQVEVYQYWFSEELYKAWKPSERFPAQPETERWLNFVADRLDLKKDIQFNTRIVSAHYRENDGRWTVTTEVGEKIDTQFVLACCGMLSAPLVDRFPGQSTFRGEIHHTGLWPKNGVELKGKRVAVIGTGATGIQVIQTIAPDVAAMKIFVRTPQYVVPMKNPEYSQADWDRWASQFHDLKKRVRSTFAGFHYDFENRPWAELTAEQRTEVLEKFWDDGSLSMWLATFPEMFFDESVSAVVSDFVRNKMRKRLRHDPKLCRLLIPEDYGFGTHRVPLENKYLEVYLRDNVEGIDCRATPIERIVPEVRRHPDLGRQGARGRRYHPCGRLRRRIWRAEPNRHPRSRRPLVEGSMEEGDSHRNGPPGARLPKFVHDRRTARTFGGTLQHDNLSAAAGRLDHRLHRLRANAGQAHGRGHPGVRRQLGEAP